MSDLQPVLTSAAYAVFALEQPITLREIAEGARSGGFPSGMLHTPDWFAAAAESADLVSMAPELQVVAGDSGDSVDVTGVDLIHVYAPEMAERLDEAPVAPATPSGRHIEQPTEARRIDLLRELSDLDD